MQKTFVSQYKNTIGATYRSIVYFFYSRTNDIQNWMLSLMKMEVIDGVHLKQQAHSNFRLRIPIKTYYMLLIVLHAINEAIHIAFLKLVEKVACMPLFTQVLN